MLLLFKQTTTTRWRRASKMINQYYYYYYYYYSLTWVLSRNRRIVRELSHYVSNNNRWQWMGWTTIQIYCIVFWFRSYSFNNVDVKTIITTTLGKDWRRLKGKVMMKITLLTKAFVNENQTQAIILLLLLLSLWLWNYYYYVLEQS